MMHHQTSDRYSAPMAEAGSRQESSPWLERRAETRRPVIKSAKLLLGSEYSQGVINCLVLDETANGVLVDLGTVFVLPEEMVLQMANGASRRVRRRWSAGSRFGLEFTGAPVVSKEAGAQMASHGRALWTQALPLVLAELRAQHFFGDDALRQAAAEAEAAYRKLEQTLTRA